MITVLRFSFLSLVLTSLFVGASAAQDILVAADAATMYIEPLEDLPNSGNPTGWTARVYDLTQDDGKGDPDNASPNWAAGQHGVGFGDSDDATEIPDDDDTYGIYTRTDFTVADASLVGGMQVAVDFDDAYIMYINGTEVNRSETAAAVVDARWDTLGAYGGDPTGVLSAPISIDAHIPLLVDGLNVLAIHVFNNTAVSSDITMIARLTLDIDAAAIPSVSSIARTGTIDEAFTSGTAEWTVTFSEAVNNVTGDDFSVTLTGDAGASGSVVVAPGATGTVFTVSVGGVTGAVGTIRLNLNDGTNIETVADATPIAGKVGPAYSVGIAMPAVGLLGLGLAAGIMATFGASAARRQKK